MVMQKKRQNISSKRKKTPMKTSTLDTDMIEYIHALKHGVYGKYNAIFSAFKLIESYGFQPIVVHEDYEIDIRNRVHTKEIQIGYQVSQQKASKESITIVFDDESKKWTWPTLESIHLTNSELNSIPFFQQIYIDKK